MIHIYCGNGKGKTTAACGLSLRASGSGMKVLFAQFFKSGLSSEITAMSKLENISPIHAGKHFGRYLTLTDAEKKEAFASYQNLLRDIISKSAQYDMIVLDEVISAYHYGMFDRNTLLDFLSRHKNTREIILTGRDPAPELAELADYITEMKKIKHPYDSGVSARKGIEF